MFFEFGEKVSEPFFVRGVFSGSPSARFESEFAREGGDFDAGVFGEGGEVMRFFVVEVAFEAGVFFVIQSCFLWIFYDAKTFGREEFDGKTSQYFADFFEFSFVGRADKESHV